MGTVLGYPEDVPVVGKDPGGAYRHVRQQRVAVHDDKYCLLVVLVYHFFLFRGLSLVQGTASL